MMRYTFPLAIALSCFAISTPSQKTRANARQPIIDVHMHCYTQQDWQDNNIPNPVTGKPLTARDAKEHFLETVAQMKRYNIVKGMVSNNFEYDVALAWRAKEPKRFLVGFGFDDPSKVDLDLLRREIKAGRIDAIGEVDPQYLGIAPTDPRLEPIFA